MPLLALGQSNLTNILAGLFILVALILVGIWVGFKGFQRSSETNLYYTFTNNVAGLRFGTPIMVAGYKVGLVTGIEPRWLKAKGQTHKEETVECNKIETEEDDAKLIVQTKEGGDPVQAENQVLFRMALAIGQDLKVHINEDSYVDIENANPLVSPVVVLHLRRRQDRTPLCAKSTIQFKPNKSDLSIIMSKAVAVLDQSKSLLKQIEEAKLPQLAKDAKGAVDSLSENANNTLTSLSETTDELKQLVAEFAKQDMAKISKLMEQLNDFMRNTDKLVKEAHSTVQTLTDTLQATGPTLTNAATDLEYMLQSTAYRLPAILTNLESATQDLSGLMANLRSDPINTLRGHSVETPTWPGESQR